MFAKRMKFISVIVAVAFIFGFANFPVSNEIQVNAASETYKPRLGVNLEGLADWSSSKMFVDVMKTSRAWGKPGEPWVPITEVNTAGWPTTDAGVVVIASSNNDISGTYKLSYKGVGTVKPEACSFTVSNQVTSKGITTADITIPADQGQLMMSFRNTVGGVSDVKLLRPGYPADTTQVFTNEFLAALEPFSTLRFMDYLATNGQETSGDLTVQEWSTRRLPTDSSQAGKIHGQSGGCYEYITQLANLTGKDVWVNVPSNASYDYMVQMANFLNNNLNPGIKIYVEYSNEVWNWQFWQAQQNVPRASADPDAKGNYMHMYAKKTYECSQAFKQVFGVGEINKRIRVTLAWQFGWSPPDSQPRSMFQFLNDTFGTPADYIYSLSVAPYFAEPKPEDCTSVAAIQQNMSDSSDDSVNSKQILLDFSKEWGLLGGVTCYEGGPHHQGQVNVNLATRLAAHRDAGMTAILTKDLKTNWFDIGGGLFMYFSLCGGYGVYGCWGLTESIADTNTPKFTAIKNLSAMTVNVVTPTPMPASDNVLTYEGFDYTPGPLDHPTSAPEGGGLNGGTNWGSRWEAQNDNIGYVVGDSGSLSYGAMQTSGNYATGALSYQSIGRTLKIGSSAPAAIKPYLNTSYAYGKKGTKLYFSFLMRPEALNSSSTFICLSTSSSGVVAPQDSSNSIFIGIFGNNSKLGNTYYWTMKIAGQYYLTTVPAMIGETSAFVTKLEFTADGGKISTYVNPPLTQEPTSPDVEVNVTNGAYSLRSITYYGGQGPAALSAIDEIRLATSYYASLTAPTPVPTATPVPTPTPTPTPTATPTIAPTPTPTIAPTATPTIAPTPTPTFAPTATPTITPTAKPTIKPTPSPKPIIRVFSVKLSKMTLTIFKGKTYKLIATVIPTNAANKKVTWKTSSSKIASVGSTGIVRGIKKGIAYITVTTVDGKKTAKCKVTVK
ncbi:MAG: Ig-like domain-containing protein [Bacillota bacterium]